jgi:hypothetical protein
MKPFRLALLLAALSMLAIPRAHAWGEEGHRIINHLAAANLPADAPDFLKSEAAIAEIEYLGPEPDRWRSPAEPELNAVQAPDHFIDLEDAANVVGMNIPHRRYDFITIALANRQDPAKIGFQPWETEEIWERLKAALREYRKLQAAGKSTREVEQAAIFYAGWLGHYVGDGSQPLHTTVNYNGWVCCTNPNDYTTDHKIHWQFEGTFVAANITSADVAAKLTPAAEIKGDIFDKYVAYLNTSHGYVEKVYQLEKEGALNGKGTQESRDFTASRIAAGASMLRDLIYTAWLRSADPVSDPYAKK